MNHTNRARRDFLRSSQAMIGAALAPLALEGGSVAHAQAQSGPGGSLWRGGEVFIGQSAGDQAPSPSIRCPLYFPSGQYANASHGLDLAAFPVRGDVTWHGDSITPDLGQSLAFNVATGTDGLSYLLVGAEGPVPDSGGYFSGVTRAIVRCKYKVVMAGQMPLLVACQHCVVVLVRR